MSLHRLIREFAMALGGGGLLRATSIGPYGMALWSAAELLHPVFRVYARPDGSFRLEDGWRKVLVTHDPGGLQLVTDRLVVHSVMSA